MRVVETPVVLLHVLGVVFRRFSLAHGAEVKLGFFVLYGLEVHPHGLLDTVTVFESARCCSRSCLIDNAPSEINCFTSVRPAGGMLARLGGGQSASRGRKTYASQSPLG